jgi:hypothetical protein
MKVPILAASPSLPSKSQPLIYISKNILPAIRSTELAGDLKPIFIYLGCFFRLNIHIYKLLAKNVFLKLK